MKPINSLKTDIPVEKMKLEDKISECAEILSKIENFVAEMFNKTWLNYRFGITAICDKLRDFYIDVFSKLIKNKKYIHSKPYIEVYDPDWFCVVSHYDLCAMNALFFGFVKNFCSRNSNTNDIISCKDQLRMIAEIIDVIETQNINSCLDLFREVIINHSVHNILLYPLFACVYYLNIAIKVRPELTEDCYYIARITKSNTNQITLHPDIIKNYLSNRLSDFKPIDDQTMKHLQGCFDTAIRTFNQKDIPDNEKRDIMKYVLTLCLIHLTHNKEFEKVDFDNMTFYMILYPFILKLFRNKGRLNPTIDSMGDEALGTYKQLICELYKYIAEDCYYRIVKKGYMETNVNFQENFSDSILEVQYLALCSDTHFRHYFQPFLRYVYNGTATRKCCILTRFVDYVIDTHYVCVCEQIIPNSFYTIEVMNDDEIFQSREFIPIVARWRHTDDINKFIVYDSTDLHPLEEDTVLTQKLDEIQYGVDTGHFTNSLTNTMIVKNYRGFIRVDINEPDISNTELYSNGLLWTHGFGYTCPIKSEKEIKQQKKKKDKWLEWADKKMKGGFIDGTYALLDLIILIIAIIVVVVVVIYVVNQYTKKRPCQIVGM